MDDAYSVIDDGCSLMDEKSWMVDDGLPEISYPFLVAFLAGAFVFRKTHPENKLCVSDQVPFRGFWFGVHLGSMWGPCGRSESNLSW